MTVVTVELVETEENSGKMLMQQVLGWDVGC
jgi:hypothetical protein